MRVNVKKRRYYRNKYIQFGMYIYVYLYDLSCIKKKRRKNNLFVYKRFDNVMGFLIEYRNVFLYIFFKFSNVLVIQDMMYLCKFWVCLKIVF